MVAPSRLDPPYQQSTADAAFYHDQRCRGLHRDHDPWVGPVGVRQDVGSKGNFGHLLLNRHTRVRARSSIIEVTRESSSSVMLKYDTRTGPHLMQTSVSTARANTSIWGTRPQRRRHDLDRRRFASPIGGRASPDAHESRWPTSISIPCRCARSTGSQNESATPRAPARPVRPMRCT